MSNLVKHPKAPVDHSSSTAAKPKLLEEVRSRIRRLNYRIRTEDTYGIKPQRQNKPLFRQ
jgi:hypothetical protein